MNVMQLYLASVPKSYSAQSIADIFYAKLACLKRVLLVPHYPHAPFNKVYLEVDFWRETPEAKKFMRDLKVYRKTRIHHDNGVWWSVAIVSAYDSILLHATCDPRVRKTVLYREFQQDKVVYSSKNELAYRVGLTAFVDEFEFPEEKAPTYASVLKQEQKSTTHEQKSTHSLKQTLLFETAKKSMEAVQQSKNAVQALEAIIESRVQQTSAMDIVNQILSNQKQSVSVTSLTDKDADLEREMRLFNESWVDDLVRPMPALIPFWEM